MRDLLTILAGLLILVLVAALAAPPFIDWRDQRAWVDATLSRAIGTGVQTDGTLDIRLLPSPRLRIERLRIGEVSSPEAASIDAHGVRAEIALTPLLHGEVRFLESRIGRVELKLPAGAGGDWRIPKAVLSDDILRRAWVFESVFVHQLFLTTVDSGTGRTEQGFAETVQLGAQSLAGPWRIEGRLRRVSFTLVTGEISPSQPTNVKVSAGGDGQPRLNLDSRLLFTPGAADTLVPQLEGNLKLAATPNDGAPVPLTFGAAFKAAGAAAELDGVAVELGEGGSTLRLAGSGRLSLDPPALSLALEGRRLDMDGLLRSGDGGTAARLKNFEPALELPIRIAAKLDSVAYRGEELSSVTARGELAGPRLAIDGIELNAPGQTQVSLRGEATLGAAAGANGRISLSTRAPDRLASYLSSLGAPSLPAGFLPVGQAVEAGAEFSVATPITSLRNIRVKAGESTVSGSLRYTAAEGGARPRLDAQLAIQNIDLATAPGSSGLFEAGRAVDLGLILDARNVGYGSDDRSGRIAARLVSEGPSLSVERLEIADLGGANATLGGRITPDGGGRVGGRLTAKRAAPLIDLVGRFWFGPLTDLVPAFLREGALELGVVAERPPLASGGGAQPLVTRLSGTASGGRLEAEIVAAEGRTRSLNATLSTDRTASWFGLPTAISEPSRLRLTGERNPAGDLSVSASGEIGGIRVSTLAPFAVAPGEDGLDAGEVSLEASDVAPVLAALRLGGPGPIPLSLKAKLDRVAGTPRVTLAGRAAGVSLVGEVSGPSRAALGGTVSLGRLSLPWLVSTLALPSPAAGTSIWPSGRFGDPPTLPFGGTIALTTATLDLGSGLAAANARFDLATIPDGIALRELEADLLGGRLAGQFAVTRQGGLASLIGDGRVEEIGLRELAGAPFTAGRVSGDLRFGGAGESAAGLVANLGGAGAIEVAGLELAGADPEGVARTAARAIRSDDPLATTRLAALASDEVGRSPLQAGKVAGQASLVAGALRASPLRADAGTGSWQGAVAFDFKTMSLDLRGSLTSAAAPRGWSGAPPYLTLGWSGRLGRAARTIDVGPLANGLASLVLVRELERIEIFELDAAERGRLRSRIELDRARKVWEEEARQARLREDAERLQAEKARAEAERILDTPRAGDGAGPRAPIGPPINIRPNPQSGLSGG